MADFNSSFDMPSASLSENAESAELQRLIAVEQQKAQFQAQVHNFTDVCWDKCMEKPSSKLDSRTETCLVSCVERFIDTTLSITNRFTQMVQKGAHWVKHTILKDNWHIFFMFLVCVLETVLLRFKGLINLFSLSEFFFPKPFLI